MTSVWQHQSLSPWLEGEVQVAFRKYQGVRLDGELSSRPLDLQGVRPSLHSSRAHLEPGDDSSQQAQQLQLRQPSTDTHPGQCGGLESAHLGPKPNGSEAKGWMLSCVSPPRSHLPGRKLVARSTHRSLRAMCLGENW